MSGNSLYDWRFGGENHNLFPFEIALLIVLGSPGLVFGFLPNWPDE